MTVLVALFWMSIGCTIGVVIMAAVAAGRSWDQDAEIEALQYQLEVTTERLRQAT